MSANKEAAHTLLERGIDGGELGAERCAQAFHGRDDRKRNTGGDQAIFNGRGGGFVGEEPANGFHLPMMRQTVESTVNL